MGSLCLTVHLPRMCRVLVIVKYFRST